MTRRLVIITSLLLVSACGLWPKKKSEDDKTQASVDAQPVVGQVDTSGGDNDEVTSSTTSSSSSSSTSSTSAGVAIPPVTCDELKESIKTLFDTITLDASGCERNSDCIAFTLPQFDADACLTPRPAMKSAVAAQNAEWQQLVGQLPERCANYQGLCSIPSNYQVRCPTTTSYPRICKGLTNTP